MSGRAARGSRVLTTGSGAAALAVLQGTCVLRSNPGRQTPQQQAFRFLGATHGPSQSNTEAQGSAPGLDSWCPCSCPSSHLEVSFLPFPGQLLLLLQAPTRGSTPPGSSQWRLLFCLLPPPRGSTAQASPSDRQAVSQDGRNKDDRRKEGRAASCRHPLC